ncbi:toll/interleukin-1 receptor domain-containing protein [Bacillus atrophaeus]|uniref:toll/interleukin-1 receptor domain-containing protein n=1 Tax=Bacillus atrophaeus TaxID=1452 RepID=UPI00227E223E|nr:toll/interleukin-1 receptor domain-containing protein [Bacillus atrophaeus]MCY8489255.1 toll/interleukin-1 receptor domain-containing protein [Bacillus atrophaeus]MCY8815972.1 toll/interleukin-1 receptor domain-containing protein [Bacillus atrophaeus]
MTKEIFISHASADKPLVDGFVKFIRLGMDISNKQIYCISYNKGEIPSGESFTEHIKVNINSAKIVILVITENFLNSNFCMAELGAAWAMDKKIIPIIVPPIKFDSLESTPLKAKQGIRLEEIDVFADELQGSGYNFTISLFNEYGEEFKSQLDALLSKIESPKNVSVMKYETLKNEVNSLVEKSKRDRQKIDELEEYCRKLEAAKDSTDVREIKKSNMESWGQLKELVGEVKDTLRPLPREVISALFYEIKGEVFRPNRQIDYDIWDGIETLKHEEKLFVDEDEAEVTVNREYPDIDEAYNVLNQLYMFIKDSYNDTELHQTFKKEYRMPLSFNTNFVRNILEIGIFATL